VLSKFGLTQNQAKVYTYLAKVGPKPAAEIVKALRFPRTETYFILGGLQERRIVKETISSPAEFVPLPLEQTILSMINAEKEKINTLSKQAEELFDLWKQIPTSALEINEDISEKMHTLQGQSQIFSKLLNMISSAKKQILVLGSIKDLSKLDHSEVFDTLSNSALDVKIVISLSKTIPSFAKMIDPKKIRLLQESSKDDQCFVIKDDEEILMFLRNTTYPSDDIFAIWSDSKALVDSMYKLFDHSWVKGEVVS
jgi:sugar-specific transcriptional regulator TrmB